VYLQRIAIIPARSGSKRISGKNFKDFLGQPLIAYPIRNLLATALFSKVIVSTDSQEIAEFSQSLGAEVPFIRQPELADDFTTTVEVIQDALIRIGPSTADNDLIFCAYPGAVLSLDSWRSFIGQGEFLAEEFLVTVGRMRNSPQRSIRRATSHGFMEMAQPENSGIRTQDLEEHFYDAGKAYAAKTSTWLAAKSALSNPFRTHELPYWEAQDLDEPVDWEIAELMLRGRI